jgi:hypothetical protein
MSFTYCSLIAQKPKFALYTDFTKNVVQIMKQFARVLPAMPVTFKKFWGRELGARTPIAVSINISTYVYGGRTSNRVSYAQACVVRTHIGRHEWK